MNGKIEFGCDFLYLFRELAIRASPQGDFDPVSDAAIKLFLVLWGFSIVEVDDANELFFKRANENKLEDLNTVAKRIVEHVIKDPAAKERILVQLSAIGCLDFNVSEDEVSYVRYLADFLDLRPSEFSKLTEQGGALAIALIYFGNEYLKAKNV